MKVKILKKAIELDRSLGKFTYKELNKLQPKKALSIWDLTNNQIFQDCIIGGGNMSSTHSVTSFGFQAIMNSQVTNNMIEEIIEGDTNNDGEPQPAYLLIHCLGRHHMLGVIKPMDINISLSTLPPNKCFKLNTKEQDKELQTFYKKYKNCSAKHSQFETPFLESKKDYFSCSNIVLAVERIRWYEPTAFEKIRRKYEDAD